MKLLPRSPIEDSGVARAFAFGTFAVGCLAIAVYGQTYLAPAGTLLVAAPGYIYSHRHRHDPPDRIRQAVIAGLVFACLAYFVFDSVLAVFGGNLPQANFVMLLVAVTSFELRTRRNLYSTMWMSLALLYLAAVFAWDVAFAPIVLAWLLCLGGFWTASHLKRIGAPRFQVPRVPLAAALVAAVALGGGAFVLLPQPSARPAGPLIVSLPTYVSFRGELENPALPLVEFGADPSGSTANINLRYRGRLGDQVVMYVRTGAPGYWRGLVFDSYQKGIWTATHSEGQTFRAYVDARQLPPPQGPQLGSFVQVYRIVQPMPGVIYAAAPVESIYYPAAEIRRDYYGDWRAPAPHAAGTTYSVVSALPDYTPGSLKKLAGQDPSPAVYPQYYDTGSLSERARALARQLTAGIDPADRYELVMALTRKLGSEPYRYSQNLSRVPPGQDPIDWFLFDAKVGYCEQFATAETLLLRSLGVPARLVTGYSTGEYNPTLDQSVVRARDAHAWVEAYFPGHGWVPVDPSPGFDPLAATRFPNRWATSGLARLIPHLTIGAPGAALGSLGALALGPGLAALLIVLVAASGWLWTRRRRLVRSRSPGEFQLLRLYERIQRRLRRRRGPAETPLEYEHAIVAGELAELLSDVTAAVNRGAYAERWPSPADMEELTARLS